MNRSNRSTRFLKARPLAWAATLWLGLVCLIALFHGLFTLTPLDKTEALQIGIAETMFRLQEWTVPHWNNHLYSDKPPLPYWFAELIWYRFGVIPEWARIPAAVTASVGVASVTWLLHWTSKQDCSARQTWAYAALGGSLLALSPGWIGFSHAAVHDIYLAVAISLALLGYAVGFCIPTTNQAAKAWGLWIGIWCGIGFLSKGLLGIALPLLIITVDQLLTSSGRSALLRRGPLICLSGGLSGVMTPWLMALIAGGHWQYLKGFLGFSHLQRATQAVDGHHQHLLFYVPILLAFLWPWWPLLISALQQLWQLRGHWRQAPNHMTRLAQLAAIWLLMGMLLFSLIPTKLPGYILPLVPAAVLLIATVPSKPVWAMRLVGLQLALLNLLLFGGLIAINQGFLGDYGSELLRSPDSIKALALLWSLSLVMAIGSGLQERSDKRWATLLLSMVLIVASLPGLAKPYRQIEQQPVLELAQAAHQRHVTARVLYVLGRPRYSVVAEAQLPTIFGSPLEPASPRPISSYANWERFGQEHEALLLGKCRSIQELRQDSSVGIDLLEQRRQHCLARLHRKANHGL